MWTQILTLIKYKSTEDVGLLCRILYLCWNRLRPLEMNYMNIISFSLTLDFSKGKPELLRAQFLISWNKHDVTLNLLDG